MCLEVSCLLFTKLSLPNSHLYLFSSVKTCSHATSSPRPQLADAGNRKCCATIIKLQGLLQSHECSHITSDPSFVLVDIEVIFFLCIALIQISLWTFLYMLCDVISWEPLQTEAMTNQVTGSTFCSLVDISCVLTSCSILPSIFSAIFHKPGCHSSV